MANYETHTEAIKSPGLKVVGQFECQGWLGSTEGKPQ
jgi:hypothetical protein